MCNYAEKYGCNKEGIARMKQLENELTAMTVERDDYKRNNAQLAQKCHNSVRKSMEDEKEIHSLLIGYAKQSAQMDNLTAQKQGDSFDAIPDEPTGYTVTTMVTHG